MRRGWRGPSGWCLRLRVSADWRASSFCARPFELRALAAFSCLRFATYYACGCIQEQARQVEMEPTWICFVSWSSQFPPGRSSTVIFRTLPPPNCPLSGTLIDGGLPWPSSAGSQDDAKRAIRARWADPVDPLPTC